MDIELKLVRMGSKNLCSDKDQQAVVSVVGAVAGAVVEYVLLWSFQHQPTHEYVLFEYGKRLEKKEERYLYVIRTN